jgi:hypothetical protein
MFELVLGGLLQLTAAHLKSKKGQGWVTVPELAEAMRKAGEEMKELLRKHGVKVDPDHESIER